MATLPTTLGNRASPTPQRRIHSVDTTQIARAEMRGAQQMEETGRDLIIAGETRERDQEKDSMLDAVRRDNEAQRKVNELLYGGEGVEGLYARKGAAALDSQKVFQERYKAIRDAAMEGVTNPTAQASLEKSLMGMETSTLGNVQRFVQTERTGYSVDLLAARGQMARDRVGMEYNNQETLGQSLAEARQAAEASAKIQGYAPGDPAWTNLVNGQEAAVYETQIGALISNDSVANQVRGVALFDKYKADGKIKSFETVQKLEALTNQVRPKVEAIQAFQKMPTVSAGDPIGFVMQDLEGGDQYVQDGAGMAKFGINSAANPDVDVANLDDAGARAIYKERYWDANKVGDLPQNMQLLAFDTAVNHGTVFKDKALAAIKNGATPDDVFIMRLNEYERLARENPEKYGDQLAGWKNRLSKLYERVYSPSAGSSSIIDPVAAQSTASGLRPEAQKEFLSLVTNHNTSVSNAIIAQKRGIVDESMQYIQQGGYSAMPVELRARAEAAGLTNDLADYTATTDKDTANYLYSLDPATLAETDLSDPAIRLKLSPADYDRWTKKKEMLGTSANLATEERRKKMVSEAFLKRNISTKTDTGKNQALRMNEMLDLEIDAFTSGNNGRYPNQAELTKIVDDMFIKDNFDNSFFGGEEYVFDVELDDIGTKERQQIEAALTQAGVAVTDSAIIKTWIKQNYGR